MSDLRVYIVNVWRSAGGDREFRATARAVELAEPQFFTSADELGRYLADAAAEPVQDSPSARVSSSDSSSPHAQRIRS